MESTQEIKLFDVTQSIPMRIRSGGRKECLVRHPTDAELCKRVRDQKTIKRILGRGKSQLETLNEDKVDYELFQKIRLDADGPPFDEAEGASAIGRLGIIENVTCRREGDAYMVEMTVHECRVSHLLKEPTMAQRREYEKGLMDVQDGRRVQEIRIFLEPAGPFFEKLCQASTGYIGAIPISHKSAAIGELLSAINAEEDEDLDS